MRRTAASAHDGCASWRASSSTASSASPVRRANPGTITARSSTRPRRHRRVSGGPRLGHHAMLDPPAVGSAHQPVVVVAADQEGVATLRSVLDVLALQLAATCRLVTGDDHLMVADHVLGGIEAHDRPADAADDRIDTVALDPA